jgi:hypothetical protein
MNRVTLYQKDFSTRTYKPLLNFLYKKSAEDCADLAFFITNAPEECLPEKQKRWARSLFRRHAYKGPSLSVGDIVRVTDCDTGYTKTLRCEPSGWSHVRVDLDREWNL